MGTDCAQMRRVTISRTSGSIYTAGRHLVARQAWRLSHIRKETSLILINKNCIAYFKRSGQCYFNAVESVHIRSMYSVSVIYGDSGLVMEARPLSLRPGDGLPVEKGCLYSGRENKEKK